MKNRSERKLSIITNAVIGVVLTAVFVLGFSYDKSAPIYGGETIGAIYRGNAEKNTVSLMFNVYENTEIVNNILETLKEKGVKAISEVVDNLPIDDKVIMVDVSDLLDSGLTGVVAIKIAEQYNKPCILLKKHFDKKTKTTVFGGSARNIDNSPIDSFKDIVNSTGFINGKGHANAFGIVDLPVDDKEKAINMMNSILRDTEYDSTYRVDFILDINHVTIPLIIKLSQFEDIICQGIDEPMLAIENISLTRDCFEVFGKNEDTISFMVNDIKYIQFKCKEGNQLYDFLQSAWDDNDSITFNIVGKPSINEYNGIRTPQIIIEDVAVISTNSNDEDDDW